MTLAAERGFSFADPYVAGLFFVGIAVFAAIGALSHERGRAFSASLVYLAMGVAAAVAIELIGLSWIDPLEDAVVVERVAELAVIIALFATGLKLDRPLDWNSWSGVARLLILAMPLTILGVAVFGAGVMGLSVGAAITLGAILAPTDPVLAGDIGVGPPGHEDEHEPNFSITGEAGLNDGLAFPFLFLGLFALDPGGTSWLGNWFAADLLYAVVIGVVAGAVIGRAAAGLSVWLKRRELFSQAFDAWLAIPVVLVIYGVTELVGAYGFIAAFAGGVAFRRYEHEHDYKVRVHDGAEVTEKFGELAAVLLLGSMVSIAGLGALGLTGWLLIPVLLLMIRPLAVATSFVGTDLPRNERAFVAWFGVRGVGSLYYAAVAVGSGYLSAAEAEIVAWTAIATIVVSIVVHGVTASPLSHRLLPPDAQSPGIAERGG
jgi:NhaP-type Na+/H+ or K+/H+ antiporter